MNQPFRLEQKPAFRVLGYKLSTTNKKKQGMKDIPNRWEMFLKDPTQKEALLSHMNQEPYGVFGINVYNTVADDPCQFDYYIAVASDDEETSEFSAYVVPETLWAIFPCTRETIGKTEVQAIMKWIPKAGYQPSNKGYITGKMKSEAPDIESYGEGDDVEVWVSVHKK